MRPLGSRTPPLRLAPNQRLPRGPVPPVTRLDARLGDAAVRVWVNENFVGVMRADDPAGRPLLTALAPGGRRRPLGAAALVRALDRLWAAPRRDPDPAALGRFAAVLAALQTATGRRWIGYCATPLCQPRLEPFDFGPPPLPAALTPRALERLARAAPEYWYLNPPTGGPDSVITPGYVLSRADPPATAHARARALAALARLAAAAEAEEDAPGR